MRALRDEHRHIASIVKLFTRKLDAIEAGKRVDPHVLYETMDYMVSWTDRFHHPREDLIYGRAAEIDSSVADDVDSLERDHDEMAIMGRKLLEAIEDWPENRAAGASLVENGRSYVERMHAHMNTEEERVFPRIEALLTADDWRDLSEDDQLRPVADPVFGPRVQRKFRNLARRARSNVRRGVEHNTQVEWIGVETLMESLEILSMAGSSTRSVASEHLRATRDEFRENFREAPLACAASNTRQTIRCLGEVLGIAKDTLHDLARIRRNRRERIRQL